MIDVSVQQSIPVQADRDTGLAVAFFKLKAADSAGLYPLSVNVNFGDGVKSTLTVTSGSDVAEFSHEYFFGNFVLSIEVTNSASSGASSKTLSIPVSIAQGPQLRERRENRLIRGFRVTSEAFDTDALAANVMVILATERGTRKGNPAFGSDVAKMIFTTAPDEVIIEEINKSVSLFEPRASVSVDSITRDGTDVSISLSILNTLSQQQEKAELTFNG